MRKHFNINNITESDKIEIFEKVSKDFRYAVLYDEIIADKGTIISEKFGIPYMIDYDNGEVSYQQIDFFRTSDEAKIRLNILPKITNKKYHNAFIVTR